MKILWLCSWYPNELDPFDGDFVERHAMALSLFTEVHVIHLVQNYELLKGQTGNDRRSHNGNLHTHISMIPFAATSSSFINKLLFNWSYQRKLKELLEAFIKENGKPDLVHVHVPVKAGAGAVWLKKKYRIPFVVTEHTSAYFDHIPFHYASRNRYFRYITRKTFSEAQSVSSVSNWLLQQLQELFQLRQVQLIRNCVDTSLFYPVQQPTSAITTFLHVSMMVPLKNVVGILQAFRQLHEVRSDWELVLAGPASDELRQLSQTMGIGHMVRFTGTLPYAEVAREMQQAHALVHFSKYENLPCVINEALCCGLPVLTSDVGGISEIINDSNGILVREGDINGLTNALVHFMKGVPVFQQDTIAAEAHQQFSYQSTGRSLIEYYQSVLKKC
jgi:glycosyltransferase involved in cell wall biosynthesis